MACVKQYSYKRQSSCSDLFVVSIYIKAFWKLQVAKAGLVRVALFSPLLSYIKIGSLKNLNIPSMYYRWTLDGLLMDSWWTLDGPSMDSRWTLDGSSIDPWQTLDKIILLRVYQYRYECRWTMSFLVENEPAMDSWWYRNDTKQCCGTMSLRVYYRPP